MKNEIDVQVGRKLRQARHLKKMTQTQLAERVGCKFQQVQKYETGMNRISASRLVLCCRALDVTPAYFFAGMGFDDIAEADMALDKREAALVCDFRKLSPAQKDLICSAVEALK